MAIAATDANALRAVEPVAAVDRGQFGGERLGAVLVEVGLGAERGEIRAVDDLRQEAVALRRRGVEADDAGRVVVDLQQLGGVGVPVRHAFEDPVEAAEVAGQPVAEPAVLDRAR